MGEQCLDQGINIDGKKVGENWNYEEVHVEEGNSIV